MIEGEPTLSRCPQSSHVCHGTCMPTHPYTGQIYTSKIKTSQLKISNTNTIHKLMGHSNFIWFQFDSKPQIKTLLLNLYKFIYEKLEYLIQRSTGYLLLDSK